ncbi:MAG: GDP-L-fucose synthase family protein [Elusimicrobiota bacterium]
MEIPPAKFWRGRRVIVTGGNGFVGRHLVPKLAKSGAKVFTVASREYDLTRESRVRALLREHPAGMILHLAARVGGIGANRANPGKFFYDNIMMGVPFMEHARRAGVDKFVQIGTICAYPKFTPVPFKEDDLWNGYPEETNAPYAIAKKALLVQAQAYRQQYGFNAIYLLVVNLYGPHDNFDLENSHVIPALIRKFLEAKAAGETSVRLWGTGKPTREFLYVDDAVEGIERAARLYDGAEPVNIGSGREQPVAEIAADIARLTGFTGELIWDASKPDGQPRRCLDTTRAKAAFGFSSRTTMEEGLKKTIAWYARERKFPVPAACRS